MEVFNALDVRTFSSTWNNFTLLALLLSENTHQDLHISELWVSISSSYRRPQREKKGKKILKVEEESKTQLKRETVWNLYVWRSWEIDQLGSILELITVRTRKKIWCLTFRVYWVYGNNTSPACWAKKRKEISEVERNSIISFLFMSVERFSNILLALEKITVINSLKSTAYTSQLPSAGPI